jgi:beta-lactamase class C
MICKSRLTVAIFITTTCLAAGPSARGQATPRARQPPRPRPGPAAPTDSTGRDISVPQIVEAVIAPWKANFQAPGVIVVVRHDGWTQFFPFGLADREHRKPVTADTIFELASITKVFTTTSLAMEVQAGRMQLDDAVAKYAPILRDNGGDIRRVTLLQLATHTSSLPRTPTVQRPDHDWNKRLLMEWLAGWRSPYPPGTKSLYSNIGVGLLGFAIADLEKKPMIDVWREQFLVPLGMRSTFFEPRDTTPLVAQGYGPKGRPVAHTPVGGWPAGGRLNSSGRDMGEFLVANMGERTDLPEITAAMQFAQRPYFKASANMTQGLAWQRVHIQGELVIDKNGGLTGTSTYIGMLPDKHVGVVVMANRGKCQATAVGRQLLMALVANQQTE